MKEDGSTPHHPVRRHLLTADSLARAADVGRGADLTRHHGQGNGMRVHVYYFVAVSLVALAMMIVAVVVANTTP